MDIASVFSGVTFWGVTLAIIFGVIWLLVLHPLNLGRPSLWWMLIAGAALFAPALFWVNTPLQDLIMKWLVTPFGEDIYVRQLLWRGIPFLILGGLVQEGAKILPVAAYWWRKGRDIDPRLGLSLGAMAGAGFGIMEAQWINNMVFEAGWTLDAVQAGGVLALADFWGNFFTMGFSISLSALAGWGLAKGWGWQFYLIAALAHSLVNYTALLVQKGLLNTWGLEIILAVCAVAVCGVVFRIRRKKTLEIPQPEVPVTEPETN